MYFAKQVKARLATTHIHYGNRTVSTILVHTLPNILNASTLQQLARAVDDCNQTEVQTDVTVYDLVCVELMKSML